MTTYIKIPGDFEVLENAAMVPLEAPIQPAQAFVDTMLSGVSLGSSASFALSSDAEILHILDSSATTIATLMAALKMYVAAGHYYMLSFAAKLDTESVDGVLAYVAATMDTSESGNSLDISGENASPTDGAANADVLALQANGWTVTHN